MLRLIDESKLKAANANGQEISGDMIKRATRRGVYGGLMQKQQGRKPTAVLCFRCNYDMQSSEARCRSALGFFFFFNNQLNNNHVGEVGQCGYLFWGLTAKLDLLRAKIASDCKKTAGLP